MKKKFLSLMMAAAVVATTSVSAFAATANVTNSDTQDGSADIVITGEVENDEGQKPAGRFEVTVPTTASFTVDSDGNFIPPDKISIKNDGSQSIDVYADKFVDSTKQDGVGITVVEESLLKSKNRTYVTLNIYGRKGNVYLKTEDTSLTSKNGIYTDNTLNTPAQGEALKLTSIASGQVGDLTLEGKAGGIGSDQDAGKVKDAVSNSFTLTLKIKKSAAS